MVKCCAPNCKNASYNKTPDISFHQFPKDEKLKKVWVNNMNRPGWEPHLRNVLCSKHFTANLIYERNQRTVLVPGAVPTLFEDSEALKEVNYSGVRVHQNKENVSALPEKLVTVRKRTTTGEFVLHDVQISTISKPEQTIPAGPSTSGTSSHHTTTIQEKDSQSTEETNKIKHKIFLKTKKIKALKQQNRRLKKKVAVFSDIIANLKEKLNQDEFHIMSGMNIKNKDFFVRYLKKAKGSSVSKSFSPELRSFALQLNFYSPRAYNFVRDSFNTVLPHPATLSRWYKKVDAEPGFTSECFETLEELAKTSKNKVLVNLSLDEMAIRKGLVWDGSENKFKGYVDTGTNVSDDSLPLATQALVLLITAINLNWVLPIAYFFINSMTGEQRANIVKMAIQMLYDINIFVCGLTFDGAAANISMATHLGCNFDLKHLQPYFMYKNRRINVFYDPCHMIKLIRNTFGEFGTIIDKDGNPICFKYLGLLLEIQLEKGLHLANKLKQAHILFGKQKMKVRLAVQLFSRSVADALSFCEQNNFNQFKGCEATVKFINIINDAFDVLNSRSTFAPGHKKALCGANIQNTKRMIDIWKDYLMNLKLLNGNLIINSARKTGFVGFIVCLHSALNMYEDLVDKGKLRFITTYKISQDFLEMFFGKMRSRGGFNDNPNVVQFRSAYKKNIIRIKLKMQSDGFSIPNAILTVSSSKKAIDTVNNTTPSFEKYIMELHNVNEEDIDCFLDNIILKPLDDYTHHVTIYIAGFIARKIMKTIHCYICQTLMLGDKECFFHSLINKKDRGGLIYPSRGLIKITQLCEKFLKMVKGNINYYSIVMYIADSFNYSDFKTNYEHDSNHLHLLVRVIVKFYIDLRMKHDAKQSNLSDRNYLKKIILFKNKYFENMFISLFFQTFFFLAQHKKTCTRLKHKTLLKTYFVKLLKMFVVNFLEH